MKCCCTSVYSVLLLVISAVVIYIYLISPIDLLNKSVKDSVNEQEISASSLRQEIAASPLRQEIEQITIALVVCGSRLREALVMMKSAIIFQSSSLLQFVIFADFNLQRELRTKLENMKMLTNNSFTYRLMNISFPKERYNEWRSMFKPCAAQRLFFPNILNDLKAVLYVDTDIVFLNELSDIWRHFKMMNSSQISALVPEHEDPNMGWYNRFAKTPFYGKLGVNSGVMLMNLTRMREFNWVDQLEPILSKFKSKLIYEDQDIINIIFHYHPEKLYIYPCRYNYRTDHCVYNSNCKDAEKHGVSIIHGSRSAFHSNERSIFTAIFSTFSKFGTALLSTIAILPDITVEQCIIYFIFSCKLSTAICLVVDIISCYNNVAELEPSNEPETQCNEILTSSNLDPTSSNTLTPTSPIPVPEKPEHQNENGSESEDDTEEIVIDMDWDENTSNLHPMELDSCKIPFSSLIFKKK